MKTGAASRLGASLGPALALAIGAWALLPQPVSGGVTGGSNHNCCNGTNQVVCSTTHPGCTDEYPVCSQPEGGTGTRQCSTLTTTSCMQAACPTIFDKVCKAHACVNP